MEIDTTRAANGKSRSLTIVIPALNEEQGIETTIWAIPRHYLETMGYAVQILVADNGSTDRTADLARQAGADVVFKPELMPMPPIHWKVSPSS
jgi:glucosyl-3-phosphoglycerate synthase